LSPKNQSDIPNSLHRLPGPVQEAIRCVPRKGLLLIEDCAQALLSKFGESPLGSFGDVAIFSIRKTLPVPDGGALVAGTNKAYHFPRMRASPLAPAVACTAASFRRHFELRREEGSRWILGKMGDIAKAAVSTLLCLEAGAARVNFLTRPKQRAE